LTVQPHCCCQPLLHARLHQVPQAPVHLGPATACEGCMASTLAV
jgi:hypothetical protein